GFAVLDYLDPRINVLYAVDTNSAGAASGGWITLDSSHFPTGGNPNAWKAHDPAQPSLCDAFGPGDLANCYLTGLHRSLTGVSSLYEGALMFADDYLSVKTTDQFFWMPTLLHHPPDYRSSVYNVDVDPATGLQFWTTANADNNFDGISDVEQALGAIKRF